MRKDYISWHEYFMGIAKLSALRSKDPRTQVGACIVSPDKRIVGIGYNGMPFGCDDNEFPWETDGDFLDTKYPYVVHAEANAILNSTKDLKDCSIYVKVFPCHECAKLIIQSGIKKVYFEEEYKNNPVMNDAAKRMFNASGVAYEQLEKTSKLIIE